MGPLTNITGQGAYDILADEIGIPSVDCKAVVNFKVLSVVRKCPRLNFGTEIPFPAD